MVKCLSRDAFGAFALAQTFVVVFESVFVARSGELAMQLIGRAWHQDAATAASLAKHLRREDLLWNLTIFAVLLLAGIALAAGLKLDLVLAGMLGLAIPLQSGYGVSKAVIVVAHRIKEQSSFEVAISLATITAVGLAVWHHGVAAAAAAYLMVSVLKTVWAHAWANRLISARCPGAPSEAKVNREGLYRLSAIAVWRNGCLAAANQADVLMVGSALGNDAVALYRVAKTMAALPVRIVAPMWVAMRPRLLAMISNDERRKLFRLIAAPGVLLLFLGVLVYPVLSAEGAKLIDLIFSSGYRDSVKPMLLLGIGAWLLSGVTGWLGFLATIAERKRGTTLLFTLNAGIILLAGALARDDLVRMALVVCVASVVTSAAAWWWLIASFQFRPAAEKAEKKPIFPRSSG